MAQPWKPGSLTPTQLVVLAAAKVGGIYANNTYPADFLLENLKIQTHVIETAWRSGVRRLLFLGSSCIYPKFAKQPIKEESLLSGSLEPTNEWYAIAKIAGIKLCESLRRQHGFDAISLMPRICMGREITTILLIVMFYLRYFVVFMKLKLPLILKLHVGELVPLREFLCRRLGRSLCFRPSVLECSVS